MSDSDYRPECGTGLGLVSDSEEEEEWGWGLGPVFDSRLEPDVNLELRLVSDWGLGSMSALESASHREEEEEFV